MTQLYAPEEYWTLTPEQKNELCNGCGTKGLCGHLVPDKILFLVDISEACNIHDFMYAMGSTIEDKDEADRVFLNNMVRLIEARVPFDWVRRECGKVARNYYDAVHMFGGFAFWKNKNPIENMGASKCAA